jgi:ubiquinone/menaquinone biosynthesis C-methylase UbiE
MKHVIHLEACDGQLFFSPIGQNPQKIIDLCTGTGLWAMDGRYPSQSQSCPFGGR